MADSVKKWSCCLILLIHCVPAFGQQLPVITTHPSNAYTATGKAHTLSCSFESSTDAKVTWYRNGSKVVTQYDNPSSKYSLALTGELFFLRFSSADAGWYYCNVTNDFGSAVSNNATLKIAVLSDVFLVHPSSASAVAGSSATLLCQPPDGTPSPQVLWKLNGTLIDIDGDTRLSVIPPGNLRLRFIRKSDEGAYICMAKNEGGEYSSRPAFLTVLEKPEFIETPVDIYQKEGTDVKFKCRAKGDPMPNVTWSKSEGVFNRLRSSVGADGSLTITDIDSNDDGAYTCTISNSGGSDTYTAFLTVYTQPVFVVTPYPKVVRHQSTVRFRCATVGNPDPVLSWSKNQDDSLHLYVKQTKGRFSVLQDGSLQINDTRETDNGEYKCYASNAAGAIEIVASLRVRDEADAGPPPIITKGPHNQTVTLTEDVELQCKASGSPSPTISWSHNKHPVLEQPRISINRGNLRISDIKVTDAGEYTCLAVSESGEAAASAYLHVLGARLKSVDTLLPPAPEKPGTRLQDITTNSVKLYWSARSGSDADVTYSVKYFTLDNREGWRVAGEGIRYTWFEITGLQPGTSYRMIVRAHNSYGVSEPSPISDYIQTTGQLPTISQPWSADDLETGLALVQVNLTRVDVLTSSDVNVTWELLSGNTHLIQGYQVRVSGLPAKKIFGSASTYHIVSNLSPYTSFHVKIMAFYHQFTSPPSNVRIFETLEDVPSGPPLSVKVKEINANTVQVSWDPPKLSHQNGVITGYVIVCKAEDPQLSRDFPVFANITNVALENLNRNTVYRIGVAASTRAGVGPTSAMWPLDAKPAAQKDTETLWKHALIGGLGGLLWVTICIIIICMCRRHRAHQKATKELVDGDIVTVPLEPATSNGLFVQYQLDHRSQNSHHASVGHPQSMSPPGAEANMRFQASFSEAQHNMDNYDEAEMKAFYNKADTMSSGPYATTMILNNMPDRDETAIPKESPHATLNVNMLHHGSESSCTDNNAGRTGAISNSSGERASPPVLPSFNDMLPPPPLYPPPQGVTHQPLLRHHAPALGSMRPTLGTMPRMGPAHCNTCQRGYHHNTPGVGTGTVRPPPQYMLDNQGRIYNPSLPYMHSYAANNEYQTTYPSMPRGDCGHPFQPYNVCSPHGHSSDSHDYAEPHFECAVDHSLYGGVPRSLQQTRSPQPITSHHTMQHHPHSVPAHLQATLLAHTNSQGSLAGRHHSLPSSEQSQELCMSCAEHTEYDEPWGDQHWSMIWDPNHAHNLQHHLQHAGEQEEEEEGGEEQEETPMLAAEQGSAASSVEAAAQSRSGSEDSKSGRQRQKRRQRAQQLPIRSSSPYNGYSTDSSVVFVPRKPYPKSQRKKQMNSKPKSTKSLAVQVEQEEISHDKV